MPYRIIFIICSAYAVASLHLLVYFISQLVLQVSPQAPQPLVGVVVAGMLIIQLPASIMLAFWPVVVHDYHRPAIRRCVAGMALVLAVSCALGAITLPPVARLLGEMVLAAAMGFFAYGATDKQVAAIAH